jgi:hypothetical protein
LIIKKCSIFVCRFIWGLPQRWISCFILFILACLLWFLFTFLFYRCCVSFVLTLLFHWSISLMLTIWHIEICLVRLLCCLISIRVFSCWRFFLRFVNLCTRVAYFFIVSILHCHNTVSSVKLLAQNFISIDKSFKFFCQIIILSQKYSWMSL